MQAWIKQVHGGEYAEHAPIFKKMDGKQLVGLSKQDMKDLVGTADGIVLHNAIAAEDQAMAQPDESCASKTRTHDVSSVDCSSYWQGEPGTSIDVEKCGTSTLVPTTDQEEKNTKEISVSSVCSSAAGSLSNLPKDSVTSLFFEEQRLQPTSEGSDANSGNSNDNDNDGNDSDESDDSSGKVPTGLV